MFSDQSQALVAHLAQAGHITPEDVRLATAMYEHHRTPMLSALLRTGSLSEKRLYSASAEYLGAHRPPESATEVIVAGIKEGVTAFGLSMAWCKNQRLFLWRTDDGLRLLSADLPGAAQCEFINQLTLGAPTQWLLVTPAEFDDLMARSQTRKTLVETVTNLNQLKVLAEEGPVIELVNTFLSQGALLRASDIHIEARENAFVSRMRIDGILAPASEHPRAMFDAVVCRIKILAQLDIAERRLPQDGRIQVRLNGDDFDIRVSILPATYGESVVLRLLRSRRELLSLSDLGMSPVDERLFANWMQLPNGIVLVTGPTGSGKTTTLYTGISMANDGVRKIITVEDPVEYRIEGITQIQVHSDIGLTFASTLRGILRHDPDVVLLGEIRDKETAEISIQAALTGHLVLSTLHTNSASASITRLIDMGVEPYLVSAAVRGLMAQRLVRRLCPHCRQPSGDPGAFEGHWSRATPQPLPSNLALYEAKPGGCGQCNHTGYWGRLAIYEFIPLTQDVRDLIRDGHYGEADIERAAVAAGGSVLRYDGLLKVAAGQTTVAEVLSVVAGTD